MNKSTITSSIILGGKPVLQGQAVFFGYSEEFWDKPFVRKRHHIAPTRSVILRGQVIEVQGDQFMAKLIDNNDFEKDGQTFVFHKNSLLCNQNYSDFDKLGKWKIDTSSNP